MQQYLGQIQSFAFDFAPVGWAQCNGQLLAINQYAALFSLLGTTYGGDGIRTFALPNLQGRVPISQGTGPGLSTYVIGEMSGTENVSVLYSEMPLHTHVANAQSTTTGAGTTPTAALPCVPSVVVSGGGTTHVSPYSTNPVDTTMSPTMLSTAGGSQPHQNMQPYLTINYCIAMSGVFPSRN
jgi:microcystin-dependent protein